MTDLKKATKKILKKVLLKAPFVGKRLEKYYDVLSKYGYEPGHYYSTIPSLSEVEKNEKTIFGNEIISDVNLNLDNQFSLLQNLKQYYDGVPYSFKGTDTDSNKLRYKPEGAFYRYSDAIFLFCMMRYLKPEKIIEIGCGNSSAIMLDTNELFFQDKINLTFIDPYPKRLTDLLREKDAKTVTVLKSEVQSVDTKVFQSLNSNDILFIDSSHVSKVGSDVNHILFNILPVLKAGIIIHFHDIFFPFELPKDWIFKHHRYWNENYLLRAFLMNNNDYEIVLFNSLLQKQHRKWFEKEMPDCLIEDDDTGSLWIRKIV